MNLRKEGLTILILGWVESPPWGRHLQSCELDRRRGCLNAAQSHAQAGYRRLEGRTDPGLRDCFRPNQVGDRDASNRRTFFRPGRGHESKYSHNAASGARFGSAMAESAVAHAPGPCSGVRRVWIRNVRISLCLTCQANSSPCASFLQVVGEATLLIKDLIFTALRLQARGH